MSLAPTSTHYKPFSGDKGIQNCVRFYKPTPWKGMRIASVEEKEPRGKGLSLLCKWAGVTWCCSHLASKLESFHPKGVKTLRRDPESLIGFGFGNG